MVARAGGSWPCCTLSQAAERDGCWTQLFLFLIVTIIYLFSIYTFILYLFTPWNGILPLSSLPPIDIPSEKSLEVCLLGDFRSHQGGNKI